MNNLTIRPATPAEWPEVSDMVVRAFLPQGPGEPRYEDAMQFWLAVPRDPTFKQEAYRLGLVDGRIVAHVGVVERILRYGQAELRFGGIAAVCTLPEYRGKGYAEALMWDAIRYMEQAGYPLSLLDGIPRYYDRFGYATLWGSHALKFSAREAALVAPDHTGYRVRPATEHDLPSIQALYEEEWGSRACAIHRSPDWLRWRLGFAPHSGLPYTYVAESAEGVVRGYSAGWRSEDRPEVVVVDIHAAAALLAHTGELLADAPDTTVMWVIPPDTRAAHYAGRLCSVDYHTRAAFHGGWRGRFIHTQAALDILRPELARRMDQLGMPGAGDLVLEAGVDGVTLVLNGSPIRLAPSTLLQLLFGFLTPEEVDEITEQSFTQDQREGLKRLFPPAINGLAGLDWF